MIAGRVSFDSAVDRAGLPSYLARCLSEIRATEIQVEGDRVSFRGGAFRRVSNWNLLVPFEHGTLEVDPMGYHVNYRLSVRQLLMFGAIITIAVLILGFEESQVTGVLPLVILIWGWLVGANLVIGSTRFRRFLARSLARAPKGSGSI